MKRKCQKETISAVIDLAWHNRIAFGRIRIAFKVVHGCPASRAEGAAARGGGGLHRAAAGYAVPVAAVYSLLMRAVCRGGLMTKKRVKGPNEVDRYVGSRVRMRRLVLGKSQTKLADAIELTFQQVQKYEKGTNRMGASRLQQVADALQVPVTYFFDGAPSSAQDTPQCAVVCLRDRVPLDGRRDRADARVHAAAERQDQAQRGPPRRERS